MNWKSFRLIKYLPILLFSGIAFTSCSVKKIQGPAIPLETIAVLPFANETTNLEGPNIMRKRIFNRMSLLRNYQVVPLIDIDAKLREIGITDGGQLNAVTPQDVGKALEADFLVYGNVIVFNAVRTRLVDVLRINMRLVDARKGDVLWDKTQGIPSMVAIDTDKSIKDNLTKYLSFAFIEKIFRSPLSEESIALADMMLWEMPLYGIRACIPHENPGYYYYHRYDRIKYRKVVK